VKSGRGIVPTAHARVLAARARVLLDGMHDFAQAAGFDPAALKLTVTIAANELQRDLLLPSLLRYCRAQAPGFSMRVIPSGLPAAEILRDDHCQLLITPRPPEGSDIMQKRLYDDHYSVFYDPDCRDPPRSAEDYLAAEHVTVLYEPRRRLAIDEWMMERGVWRRFVAEVPGFAGLPPFLRGSRLIATLPSLLRAQTMKGFAMAPVPVACPPMPMYAVWHLRHQADPVHRWLRENLEMVVAPALAAVG
jgi:DNA-binding transcriptional LysR family regulator